jgi:iron-sulfur cluster assembly protein
MGAVMGITLTENAAQQILKKLAKRGKGIALRVGVKKVGCSGFAYTFDYADEIHADDQLLMPVVCSFWMDQMLTSFVKGSTTLLNLTTLTLITHVAAAKASA